MQKNPQKCESGINKITKVKSKNKQNGENDSSNSAVRSWKRKSANFRFIIQITIGVD